MNTTLRVAVGAVAAIWLSGCQPQVNSENVGLDGFPYPVNLPSQCAPVVEQHVAAFGLADQVESITYLGDDIDLRTPLTDLSRRMRAWVDLTSCQGYLVFDMRDTCRVRRVFTRGDCRIPEREFAN